MKHEALFELWAEGMLVVDSHAHGMWWDTRPRIADAGGVMEVPVSEMQRELSIYGAEQKHGRERKQAAVARLRKRRELLAARSRQ